jgi:hypothetical protein
MISRVDNRQRTSFDQWRHVGRVRFSDTPTASYARNNGMSLARDNTIMRAARSL